MTRRGRSLLMPGGGDYEFDPESVTVADEDILDPLELAAQEWWVDRSGEFVPDNGGFLTPPQRGAIPRIHDGDNAFICVPTGSGKMLVSFMAIINELFRRERESPDGLDNSVYCLYASPLKSLANDIRRNLTEPLSGTADIAADRGGTVDIGYAIRHDDTFSVDRQKIFSKTPHIFNMTPEALAILPSSPKFKEKFRTVEYVVVDEIHSLTENKRGTHLSMSLERLEDFVTSSPTHIGCSATIEPLDTVAEFFVGREDGEPRDYELVDTRLVRDFDVRLGCPTDDLIRTPRSEVQNWFHDRLHDLVALHTNMLVFINTRSGVKCALHNLRGGFDDTDELNSGCRHGSLSRERRQEIGSKLRVGELRVTTTSTGPEPGIDMPHTDLVVRVGSPKSVVAFLQWVGRAGHRSGQTIEGRVIALDRDELIKRAVMPSKVESGFVDQVFIPENAFDVAAQQVYGMAINAICSESEPRETLRRACSYRNFPDSDFEHLFRYLIAGYDGLENKNVYAKIWRDANDPPDGEHHYEGYPAGEPLIGRRDRTAHAIYMTNIGTTLNSLTCDVLVRGADQWVGMPGEGYLDTLEKGDVFVLGGDHFVCRCRRGSKVYVDRTSQQPTVPSWFSERLPLPYNLGRELAASQAGLAGRLDAGGAPAVRSWLRESPLDEDSVRVVTRMFDEQVRYAGPKSVATLDRLVVETGLDHEAYRRQFYACCTYGRRSNNGFSRLLAYHAACRTNADVQVAVADNGLSLSIPLNRKVDLVGVLRDLDPEAVEADLRAVSDGTDLLKHYFRIDVTRSLTILKRYKGCKKLAAQQQASFEMLLSPVQDLDEFVAMEEAYREILENKLNLAAIEDAMAATRTGDVDVTGQQVSSPTPRAFGLAMLIVSDVVLAEDESAALREFHKRVKTEINDGESDLGIDVGWDAPQPDSRGDAYCRAHANIRS